MINHGNVSINFFDASTTTNIEDDKHASFQVRDLIQYAHNHKIIEIIEIVTDKSCRKTGIGSQMLKMICNGNDDMIIIAGAGALVSEYPEEPTDEEWDKLFKDLTTFYNKNNFEDVTKLFGTYDGTTRRTFLYKNQAGLNAIAKREKVIKDYEDKMTI